MNFTEIIAIIFASVSAVYVIRVLDLKFRRKNRELGTLFIVDAVDNEDDPELYLVPDTELFKTNDEYAVIRIVRRARD